MSNISHLLQRYRDTAQADIISRALDSAVNTPKRIQLSGLSGAQRAFVAAAVAQKKNGFCQVFIAESKEEAAYLHNDLESLLSGQTVFFFPDSFKRPAFFDEINPTQVLQRSEVVSKAVGTGGSLPVVRTDGRKADTPASLIVTYPEALFEKVVNPNVLAETRIRIAAGERLDVDFVIEVLIEYGFERTDFVYEPGQFSIRGGIVDLFSWGNELPYRIELFDDEVESIRSFDPLTQLSKQNIREVNIVPNLNTRFRQDQKVSLLDVLPPDTALWVKDIQFVVDRLQFCFDKAEQYATKISALDSAELREIFRDRAFLYPREILAALSERKVVFWEKQDKSELVAFRAHPQPSFNKNFDLLIRSLHEWQAAGYEVYIFSENEKQFDRLAAIFRELKAKISWFPVEAALSEGFLDEDLKIACLTDHQIFQRFHAYKLRQGFSKEQALNIRLLRDLQPGDFVTHIDHGIGKFSGLQKIEIGGQMQEAVRLVYKNNDTLYVSIHSLHKISKYVGQEGTAPQLSKLGSDAWKQLKARTKKKIKDIAGELIKLYAKRRAAPGHAFPPDGYLQNELEASFLYEDTPDQYRATQEVKADMEKPYPMDRLICGDVGFGKTEVAIRAAFKAVTDGKQVAVLVPTTILALQHWKTFSDRLKDFPVTVDYINRFRSAKERREIFEKLASGKIDMLIGTHALLNKEVKFKDLGLLVVDEEQKFGVAAKEKLRAMAVAVDTLTLTATPIPRTLQFSLMAARDLSVIRTPPPNRQPIHTEIRVFDDDLIRDAIYTEVNRGGQVFFVHNRVADLGKIVEVLTGLCPGIDIAVAHGQMDAEKLEQVLVDFIDRRHDVLVSTNIIETGLDIPNANTIIINRADMFGLSDLHQLRGRVGRSNVKAYCYLFAPPLSVLTQEARKRLKTIEEFSELGSGFQVAMRDLDIRGAGNLLGGEQSGFIADIGYETYQKILDEAIQELKETDFKDLFKEELAQKGSYVRDVTIETDVEMLIPDDYVTNTQERLNLYTELDALETEDDIAAYAKRLEDRFGKLPRAVSNLFEALRLRWMCKKLGFERLILKGGKLRCYFLSDPQSSFFETQAFQKIMAYVASKGRIMGISMKQTNKELILVQDEVKGIRQAKSTLDQLLDVVAA
ncbi:MAG: transcription-repair coupling factor [Saprospiraceae bacterium]|nr:transcription-repair coupling factor [Saprospiraceae bacterium]